MTGYELWDTASRNLLDDFATEAEALGVIRELIALNGPASAETLALTRVDGPGQMTTLATGAALAAWAQAAAPPRGRLPA